VQLCVCSCVRGGRQFLERSKVFVVPS
jgi:hypothetical protein